MHTVIGRSSLTIVAAVAVCSLAVLALMPGRDGGLAEAQEKAAAYAPVVELDVIMDRVDEIFGDLEKNLAETKFRTLRKDSAFLAELMNITAFFDHTEYSKETGWKVFSVKTRDLLLEATNVSKKKDGAAYKALLGKIEAACDACHEKYRDI